jgi:hypothetical protein
LFARQRVGFWSSHREDFPATHLSLEIHFAIKASVSSQKTLLPEADSPSVHLNLTRDIAKHIVLRKDKVEIGNLAGQVSSASGRRMSLDIQEARKRDE